MVLVVHNFCRGHGSLKKTPAMAAQLTGHPWPLEVLVAEAESEMDSGLALQSPQARP